MRVPYNIPPALIKGIDTLTAVQGESSNFFIPEPGAFGIIGGGWIAYAVQFSTDGGDTWGDLPDWARFDDRELVVTPPVSTAEVSYPFRLVATNEWGETPDNFTLVCTPKKPD